MRKHESQTARKAPKQKLVEVDAGSAIALTEQDLEKVAGGLNFTKITYVTTG